MQYFHDLSLRTKLIVSSLVITLIPLTIIGYVSNLATRQALVHAANESLDGAARETAANLDGFIQANLDAVRTEAQLPDFGGFLDLSPEERAARSDTTNPEAGVATILLALSRRDQLYITSYALLDANGINVIDTEIGDTDVDQSRQDYFREPATTGLPYVSAVEFPETDDPPSLYFSAPIRNMRGKTVGVLRIRYNATILQQIIANTSGLAGEESFAVLLDENHLRLADGSTPDLNFKTVVPLDPTRVAKLRAAHRLPQWPTDQLSTNLPAFEQGLANAATEEFFRAELDNPGTSLEAIAVAPMTAEPWLVAFAQTEAVFLAPVESETRNSLIIVLIVTALVTLTAIGGAQVVTSPILHLTAAARRVGAGDLGAQARVEGKDEIGTLATTFNAMTAQLRQTLEGLSMRTVELRLANEQLQAEMIERQRGEEALREAETRYRLLVERIPAITYIVSAKAPYNTVYISPQVQQILGFTPEEWVSDPDIWERQIYPEDRERVLAEDINSREKNRPFIGEYRIFTRDGRLIWLHDETYHIHEAGLSPFSQGIEFDITDRKQAEEKIRRQIERLTALNEIDRAITSSFGLDISLGTILKHVTGQLGVDAATVLLLNSATNTLTYAAGRGFRTKAFERGKPVRLGEGYAGRAALERRTIHVHDLAAQNDNPSLQKDLPAEGFVSYYGVPLIAKGQIKGVLEVFHRAPLEPDEEWLHFLHTLAGQAAIAIDNATLFDGLQHSNIELGLAYDATIEGWSHALDLRDEETEGHTKRVTDMTLRLADLFGLGDDQLVHVRRGALLHDIGKMGVPDHILLKPGQLTDEEWVIMRKHPQFAFDMLAPIRYLQPALDIPYCHHEKWDGTGYPRGLKGEQIPLVARIFAIVDVWDALASDRPYRAAWTQEKILEHIQSLSGTHFDPQIVKIVLESGVLWSKQRA